MSGLQLSDQLVDAVQNAVSGIDERARDPFIAVQYLAALTGYMVAKQDMSDAQKRDILQQLTAFSEHVLEDVCRQAPPQEAFGIWRPGD